MFTVNAMATEETLNGIEYEDDWYLRFQNKNWEIGEQSWEMMYETADEAREAYEEDGLDPDDAVLDGKSCCCTWHEAAEYAGYYDEKDTVVLLIRGFCNCTGHDGEAVGLAPSWSHGSKLGRQRQYAPGQSVGSLVEPWI